MIDWINNKQYWQPALDQSGNDRTDPWLLATAGKIITRAGRNQLLLPETEPEKDLLKLLLENTRRLKHVLPAAPG